MNVTEFAAGLGIDTCLEFAPELLVPEDRIRAFCRENKCGKYENNYMCPPHIGELDEFRAKLGGYRRGLLLRYTKALDVPVQRKAVEKTKVDFHKKILKIEDFLREQGFTELWGMGGGSCGLCRSCGAKTGKPCPYPDRARMSIEAAGVDVLGMLEKLGQDNKFHPDRVTWTGCVLFKDDV